MQPDANVLDQLSALRTRYVRHLCAMHGYHERMALPVANVLIDELQTILGGTRIPMPSAADRAQAIRDAAALGHSVDTICRDFGIHRCTVYRALGKPTTDSQAA